MLAEERRVSENLSLATGLSEERNVSIKLLLPEICRNIGLVYLVIAIAGFLRNKAINIFKPFPSHSSLLISSILYLSLHSSCPSGAVASVLHTNEIIPTATPGHCWVISSV